MILFLAIDCHEDPIDIPTEELGRRIWSGSKEYESEAVYDCGPYAKFQLENGELLDELINFCQWNKIWSLKSLPECKCK